MVVIHALSLHVANQGNASGAILVTGKFILRTYTRGRTIGFVAAVIVDTKLVKSGDRALCSCTQLVLYVTT